MNNFFRPFSAVSISDEEVTRIYSMLEKHNDKRSLHYHGYLNVSKTLRLNFARNLRSFSKQIGLSVAGIYAFTAKPGAITSIHCDGDQIYGRLPWRLAFYVAGEPGILTWHDETQQPSFQEFESAFVYDDSLPVIHSELLNIKSAFVRTDIPHRLDTSKNLLDRLTITATFNPRISWEELNERLDSINA